MERRARSILSRDEGENERVQLIKRENSEKGPVDETRQFRRGSRGIPRAGGRRASVRPDGDNHGNPIKSGFITDSCSEPQKLDPIAGRPRSASALGVTMSSKQLGINVLAPHCSQIAGKSRFSPILDSLRQKRFLEH
jgi:hypothetical protein